MTIKIDDIWRIQNKKKKTYKKIGSFFYDIKRKLETGELKEDITMSEIYKIYKLEPRTQTKHFGDYLHKIGRKKFLLLQKEDILIINEAIAIFMQYKNLEKRRQKLIKYLIYFLLGAK